MIYALAYHVLAAGGYNLTFASVAGTRRCKTSSTTSRRGWRSVRRPVTRRLTGQRSYSNSGVRCAKSITAPSPRCKVPGEETPPETARGVLRVGGVRKYGGSTGTDRWHPALRVCGDARRRGRVLPDPPSQDNFLGRGLPVVGGAHSCAPGRRQHPRPALRRMTHRGSRSGKTRGPEFPLPVSVVGLSGWKGERV